VTEGEQIRQVLAPRASSWPIHPWTTTRPTYRIGPHTTTDDPQRYRSPEVVDDWRQRDPLERLRRYLAARQHWDAEMQDRIEREAGEEIAKAVAAAEALPPFEAGEIFDAMFATPPPHLAQQRAAAEQAAAEQAAAQGYDGAEREG
jgi:pyruvate dehydrogenase E1 component alpha subunit